MNIIKGKILVKETSLGIPNLVVVIYDIDARTANDIVESYKDETQNPPPLELNYFWAKINGDRLGSVITDAKGEFNLSYEDSEFMIEKKESRPDLILYVLAPEENLEFQILPTDLTPHIQPSIPSTPLDATHVPTADAPLPNESPIINEPKILYQSKFLRANAGKIESYVIKISNNILLQFGINVTNEKDNLEEKKNTIQTSIQNASVMGDAVKNALNNATKEKLQQAAATRKKAKKIFHPLMLSAVSSEIRNKSNYLHSNDDLKKKHKEVINNGLKKLSDRSNGKNSPSLTISTKDTDEGPGPTPDEIINILQDQLSCSSVERVFQRFPKNDYSKIAENFINEIVNPSTL